jgi:hypothetical protein
LHESILRDVIGETYYKSSTYHPNTKSFYALSMDSADIEFSRISCIINFELNVPILSVLKQIALNRLSRPVGLSLVPDSQQPSSTFLVRIHEEEGNYSQTQTQGIFRVVRISQNHCIFIFDAGSPPTTAFSSYSVLRRKFSTSTSTGTGPYSSSSSTVKYDNWGNARTSYIPLTTARACGVT